MNLPGDSIMLHLLIQVCHTLEQRWKKVVVAAYSYRPLEPQKEVSPRATVQHSTDGSKTEKMNDCSTWPRRITKLKIVNSEAESEDQISYVERYSRFPEGVMPPWRIQNESHTCSEQSLRIRLWSASYVQKTPTIKWQDEYTYKYRRIITVEVDPPSCDLYAPTGGTINQYIYIESRYVLTGTQGVSSLAATDPLGPRWPPAT